MKETRTVMLTKIRSAAKFVSAMNLIKGSAMIVGKTFRINAKSLLGTMNAISRSNGEPVKLEIDTDEDIGMIESVKAALDECGVEKETVSNKYVERETNKYVEKETVSNK